MESVTPVALTAPGCLSPLYHFNNQTQIKAVSLDLSAPNACILSLPRNPFPPFLQASVSHLQANKTSIHTHHQTQKTQRIKESVPRLVSRIESNMSSYRMSQRGTCRRGDTPRAPAESINFVKSFQNIICINWRVHRICLTRLFLPTCHSSKKNDRWKSTVIHMEWPNDQGQCSWLWHFHPSGSYNCFKSLWHAALVRSCLSTLVKHKWVQNWCLIDQTPFCIRRMWTVAEPMLKMC